MADENSIPINGVASAELGYDDDTNVTINEDNKLKQKIESLQQEKILLEYENSQIKDQILKLTAEMESLKSNEAEMKKKMESMEGEKVEFEESKKALEVIAKRTMELETEVSRLQHDLITAEGAEGEAGAEIVGLKRQLGEKEAEFKAENAETEKKVRELERKIGVLEVKETEEKSKRVRIEEEMRERVAEREGRIGGLEREIAERDEKVRETEGKLVELQKQLEEAERVVSGVKEKAVEVVNGIEIGRSENGLKGQWPIFAVGSAGVAVGALAAMGYVRYARRS